MSGACCVSTTATCPEPLVYYYYIHVKLNAWSRSCLKNLIELFSRKKVSKRATMLVWFEIQAQTSPLFLQSGAAMSGCQKAKPVWVKRAKLGNGTSLCIQKHLCGHIPSDLKCHGPRCIVDDVGNRFWQNRRMQNIKDHLWFCCIKFWHGFKKVHNAGFSLKNYQMSCCVWQCYRSVMLNQWRTVLSTYASPQRLSWQCKQRWQPVMTLFIPQFV